MAGRCWVVFVAGRREHAGSGWFFADRWPTLQRHSMSLGIPSRVWNLRLRIGSAHFASAADSWPSGFEQQTGS